jgi:hypothetical protein
LTVAIIAGNAAAGAPAWAQDAAAGDTAKADSTRIRPVATPEDTLGHKLGDLPIYFTGFVTSTYTYSFASTDGTLVGRFYDRYQDQFMINALRLGITKPAATDKLDAGFRFELLFGQDAAVTQSAGLSLGPDADLTEAYVTLNVPLAKGKPDHWMQFKLGKMWTIMGYEVIDDVLNPNLDVGNQFIYLENFTNTGLGVDFQFGPKLDVELRFFNGWDVVQETNDNKSFMARLGWTPSGKVNIGVLGYTGAEQPNSSSNLRSGVEVLGTFHLGSKTTVVGQADYGEEKGLLADPDQAATWWGLGLWLVQDLSSTLNLALRGDYVDDKDGVRTSGVLGYAPTAGRQIGSVTATLNIHVWKKATVRPEARLDFSSLDDYGEVDNPTSTQPSLGIGVSYQF